MVEGGADAGADAGDGDDLVVLLAVPFLEPVFFFPKPNCIIYILL
jgi:hypothetical protein